jgi:hypothetical protein
MNPIVFALRHPITMIMLVVALIGGGALALTRMRIDFFPPINQPSIYVFTNYGGYDSFQMEGLLVSPLELWFQFVDGVRSMESKSIQQVAVIKLSFHPDTDMSKAMAQVVSVASRAQATQPAGTLPPLIMQMDAGNVPVGYLAYVAPGSQARVRVPALANHEFPARVTRTSWALNPTSRTLMAQVELPNPRGRFSPACTLTGRSSSSGPMYGRCRCRLSPRSATKLIATWRRTARPRGLRCRPASATGPG